MEQYDRTGDHRIAAHAPGGAIAIKLGHRKGYLPAQWREGRCGAHRAGQRQRGVAYLRKIHHMDPTTRIRLPARMKRSSMPCFPGWWGQAGWSAARCLPCAGRPPSAWCRTGRRRRVRRTRIGRTGWPRRVRTGSRRSSTPHARGVRFPGQKPGGIHKRSWGCSVGWCGRRCIINANSSHLQSLESGTARNVPDPWCSLQVLLRAGKKKPGGRRALKWIQERGVREDPRRQRVGPRLSACAGQPRWLLLRRWWPRRHWRWPCWSLR